MGTRHLVERFIAEIEPGRVEPGPANPATDDPGSKGDGVEASGAIDAVRVIDSLDEVMSDRGPIASQPLDERQIDRNAGSLDTGDGTRVPPAQHGTADIQVGSHGIEQVGHEVLIADTREGACSAP